MAEFKLPELGENIESGEITKILVAKGDSIEKDQAVIELETGKATVEVPCPLSGTIQAIKVQEGDEVQVGQTILTVGEDTAEEGEAKKEAQAAEPEAETEESAETEEDKSETAEASAADEEPEPEDDEAEQESEQEAVAEEHEKTQEEKPQDESEEEPEKIQERSPGQQVPAAPSVRKLAREIGVEINQVSGSGPHGRVSRHDVKDFAKESLESGQAQSAPAAGAMPQLPDFRRWGETEAEQMNNIRRRTAEHMALCWAQVPHVTQFDRGDISELETLRKRFAGKVEKAGGKLTITAIILKVVASALKVFPKFNASLDMQNQTVIYKKYYHVGLAVDTQRGLLVPVLRDVEKKNIIELAVEMGELAERTRNGKIAPDELEGATFTITNLGSIGGTHFAPIINYPQVAILGVGRAFKEPCFDGDGICKPRLILPLSLSYDHRLIDGADGARFTRWIAEALEEPLLLALEG